jgi:hypothetical protein
MRRTALHPVVGIKSKQQTNVSFAIYKNTLYTALKEWSSEYALNSAALLSAELVKLLLGGWTADVAEQNSPGKSPSLPIKVWQATSFR